jgi:hypothetical protein
MMSLTLSAEFHRDYHQKLIKILGRNEYIILYLTVHLFAEVNIFTRGLVFTTVYDGGFSISVVRSSSESESSSKTLTI